MLRAIISQAAAGVQFNEGAPTETTGNRGRSALEKIYMQQSIKSIASQGNKSHLVKQYYNWEDIESFTQALEKLEAWIFSKITKSLWWQVDHLIFLSFSPITSATLFTVQSLIFACRLWLHICSFRLQKLVRLGAQGWRKHMGVEIHWVIKSRANFL